MADRTNVVLCVLSTKLKCVFLLLLFFPHLKFAADEECDFLNCVLNTSQFMSNLQSGGGFSCGSLSGISGCSDNCMRKYYPNVLSHSDPNPDQFTKFCSYKINHNSDINWTCIANHSFRLLTCLANVSSLTANSIHEQAIAKESCRKSLEFPNCASEVLLSDCGEDSVAAVKLMLRYGVNYFMPSSCKEKNTKKILSMPVNYSLEPEFLKIAGCMDRRIVDITGCFRYDIYDDLSLHEFVCGDDFFSSCVGVFVRKNCAGADDASVRRLLLKIFSFGSIRCEHYQFAFKHLTVHPSLDSVTTKSTVNVQIDDIKRSTLNNENFELSDSNSGSAETSTLQTEISRSKTNVKIQLDEKGSVEDTSNDFKKVPGSDSLVKNSSKKPSHIQEKQYVKTASGVNLNGDKTLIAVIFILMILIFKT